MLKKSELRKALVLAVDVICDEADKNPLFAERLQSCFIGGGTSEKTNGRQKGATLDPFNVLEEHGIGGLRSRLENLELADLKSIVRTHRFDPSRLSDKWKTRDRFIELIIEKVEARAKQGDAFRQYGLQKDSLVVPPVESPEGQSHSPDTDVSQEKPVPPNTEMEKDATAAREK